MPMLQVWKSGTVMFIKRSLAFGYAGIGVTLADGLDISQLPRAPSFLSAIR